MSVRSRLLLATGVLVALGLLAANIATYMLLRSSLIGRIDDQLVGSRTFAIRDLVRGGSPEFGFGGGRRDAPPNITYGALVDSSGTVASARVYVLGDGPNDPPLLPPALPGSSSFDGSERERSYTVVSQSGSVRYRLHATALENGTLVVGFPLTDAEATLRRLVTVALLVTLSVLAAVVLVSMWLVRVGLRPLTQIEQTAAEIAGGNLSRRVSPSDDQTEVGRLGGALNRMLERIEAAFAEKEASEARLRRFVADASHELRTPLTSIRGYAELFRHGASARPADMRKSMQRIEEESTRMTKLVEELLLLARLDQRPELEREPVDLVAIAEDASSDARAVDPSRPIDLTSNARPIVYGDDARLRQVAANLLANALQHTPPGTPIHVRAGEYEGEAILEVADEGPGLSPEDAEKVFDRFYRVDPSRARENGGAGLGLSIVAAIVEAHGGRVALDTRPGEGARFIVMLPLGAPDPGPGYVSAGDVATVSADIADEPASSFSDS